MKKSDLRKFLLKGGRTHLEVAMRAAVKAGLVPNERTAREQMEQLLIDHTATLKHHYLWERNGGIKGWHLLLRTYDLEEHLGVRKRPAIDESQPTDK